MVTGKYENLVMAHSSVTAAGQVLAASVQTVLARCAIGKPTQRLSFQDCLDLQ
jgi:hypothetical protein